MKVLYVEDEANTREICSRYLRKEVCELVVASHGDEGREICKSFQPDIIVTDLNMPQMDGIELIAEVKKYHPDISVIVTTAFNDEAYFLRSIDVGVDKYLKKPVNLNQLYRELTNLAESTLIQEQLKAAIASNEEKYQTMLEEVEMAASLQKSLLPQEGCTVHSDLDIRFLFKPCSAVSGDFLIVDKSDDRYVTIMVIDVMGHGVASGLITIEIKTLYEQLRGTMSSPMEILKSINAAYRRLTESSYFLTASCAIFDSETSMVSIASAGGVPFIFYQQESQSGTVINLDGAPIGLFSNDEIDLGEESYELKEGDYLIFQTDGLIESFNKYEESYDSLLSQEKVLRHIQAGKSSETVLKDIWNDVLEHKGNEIFGDDVTILVLRRLKLLSPVTSRPNN